MLQLMSTQPDMRIRLIEVQALLGMPLDNSISILSMWWVAICATAIWYIWLACNMETRVKIWNETKLYMKVEWSKYRNRIESGTITEDRAEYLFGFNFGQCQEVYSIVQSQLSFARLPPEPD